MRDDPVVTDLVIRASGGDRQAWDALVDRYAPLIWRICRRYQLSDADAKHVGQAVGLHLAGHLDSLPDPAALPGWLATTTQRECLRVVRAASRYDRAELSEASQMSADQPPEMIEQQIIAAEQSAAVRAAFAELPDHCRRLLSMLISDPPLPYAEISAALSVRIGSIGPQRARCLNRLRRSPGLAAFCDTPSAKGLTADGAHKMGGRRGA